MSFLTLGRSHPCLSRQLTVMVSARGQWLTPFSVTSWYFCCHWEQKGWGSDKLYDIPLAKTPERVSLCTLKKGEKGSSCLTHRGAGAGQTTLSICHGILLLLNSWTSPILPAVGLTLCESYQVSVLFKALLFLDFCFSLPNAIPNL